jgi:cysteine desulfurase
MERQVIYLDYNATTPLHPAAQKAMEECTEIFANPASIHSPGRAAEEVLERDRERIAGLLGALPSEIVFTGGGSESNAAVFASFLFRALHAGDRRPRGRILVSAIEHPSVMAGARRLAAAGFDVRHVGVDAQGSVDMAALEELLEQPACLVSVMIANNEIGTVQDLAAVSRLAHGRGALVHADAVQAAGKLPLDFGALAVDFASFSAHKIHGPKGVGALYIREGTPFEPLIPGGDQENNRRAGTVNVPGIHGFAAALARAVEEMPDMEKRLLGFSHGIHDGISGNIPGARFNSNPDEGLVGTVSVSFEGLEGEALMLRLDREGIAVSTGAACESRTGEPSHVLSAIGLSRELARGTIRISMGRGTTAEEVERLLEVLPAVVKETRAL